eukprot:14705960-Heterocapsa_arctica.AAC.1
MPTTSTGLSWSSKPPVKATLHVNVFAQRSILLKGQEHLAQRSGVQLHVLGVDLGRCNSDLITSKCVVV